MRKSILFLSHLFGKLLHVRGNRVNLTTHLSLYIPFEGWKSLNIVARPNHSFSHFTFLIVVTIFLAPLIEAYSLTPHIHLLFLPSNFFTQIVTCLPVFPLGGFTYSCFLLFTFSDILISLPSIYSLSFFSGCHYIKTLQA